MNYINYICEIILLYLSLKSVQIYLNTMLQYRSKFKKKISIIMCIYFVSFIKQFYLLEKKN